MLALRTINDAAPDLEPLTGLVVRRERRADLLAQLQARSSDEISNRFALGHRAYVAYVDGEPAAFGWVATSVAVIGELGATFELPVGERYLWNFVTLTAHRGKGIYPRLVDEIVRAESGEADRFWIAYAPENRASGSGIRKAGFTTIARLSFDADGRAAISIEVERGSEPLAVGLPIATEPLFQCWRCVRAASNRAESMGQTSCGRAPCCCDYQRPDVECAA
jgi:GNAT superfamily N-acetyltransferase